MTWDWQIDGWIIFVGVLSAGACALLGNYLVLRKMSLMGDAISHAVLPGLAIAFLISQSRSALPMFTGAVIVGILTAILTQTINRYGKVEHGAAMGVVFSVLFAVGLILIRRAADHVDLDPGCVLYGNIVQIPLDAIGETMPAAARNLIVVFLINVAFVAMFYKELKICAFDPELATTLGINATLFHYALMIMVAITTVACFESVGSILVIAMLIVPAATARLLTDRLGIMIVYSLIVATAAAVVGHLTAVYSPAWFGIDGTVNTAAMIAVITGVFFVVALFLSPQYGLISRVVHRLTLSLNILREDILGLLFRWHEHQPQIERPMHRSDLLTAVGNNWLARFALNSLARQRLIATTAASNGLAFVQLTQNGLQRASQLIRSHRLWEVYLAKHLHLPLDHLHMPAERMEHFITPEMRSQLQEHLTDPKKDPHGKQIP